MSIRTPYRPSGEHSQAYWWLDDVTALAFTLLPCVSLPLLPSASLSLMESDIISNPLIFGRLIFLGLPPAHLSHHLVLLYLSPDSAALLYHYTTDPYLQLNSASWEAKIYTGSSHVSYLRPAGLVFHHQRLMLWRLAMFYSKLMIYWLMKLAVIKSLFPFLSALSLCVHSGSHLSTCVFCSKLQKNIRCDVRTVKVFDLWPF